MYQKTKLITPNPTRPDVMHGPLLTLEADIVMRPGAQDFLLIRSRGDAC